MDYPHPLESLKADGTIDISQRLPGAHRRLGQGHDQLRLPAVRDRARTRRPALTKILDDAWAQDIRYFTNQDIDSIRASSSGRTASNQADELTRLMKVRRAALNRIGEHTIRAGAPMTTIEEPLVPIFMYHRYAVESAASMVGGQDYIYAMRGDGRTPTKWESAANQRKALDVARGDAEAVRADRAAARSWMRSRRGRRAMACIASCSRGRPARRSIRSRPATIAADVTIGFVLQLDRAARMVAQHAVDPALPGLEEVIDRLTAATFDAPTATPYEAAVRRAEQRVLVSRVMWLAQGSPNNDVRAIASLRLERLAARLRTQTGTGDAEIGHRALLAADIKRFLERSQDAGGHRADAAGAARRADRRPRAGLVEHARLVRLG